MDQTDAQVVLTPTGVQCESFRDIPEQIEELIKDNSKDKNIPRNNNEYPMQSLPRGYSLIINNSSFKPESGFQARTGSEEDVRKLFDLFNYLGFYITSKQDLGSDDIKTSIEDFQKMFVRNPVDMCVVCVMSHGSNGNLLDINGKEMDVEEDIVRKFYNNEAPFLQGLPKLFLLQYCRGDELDFGVEESFTETRGTVRPLESAPILKAPKLPSATDILIANSTIPGFVSNRNTKHGAWFFQCLETVFRELAENMDIRDMFDQVAMMLNEKESKDTGRRKQTFEVINRGFFKKLFFNPTDGFKQDSIEVWKEDIEKDIETRGDGFRRKIKDPWRGSFN